jgi:glycosyltransferase involved in cell wall biosynthesis
MSEYISICIPIYNRREFLPFILRNVMIQDHPKQLMEVVIDDDSPDGEELFNSEEELENFKKIVAPMKVKYLRYNYKRTIGKKRNNLVINSSYDTIAMMDSDDCYCRTYLSHSLEILKEKKVGMVGINNMIMLYPPYSNRDFYYLYTGKNKRLIHECSMVFTKSFWRKSPKFDDSSRGEGLKILRNINKVSITDPIKVMIQICHSNNTVNKDEFKQNPIDVIEIDEELRELIEEVVNYRKM